MDVFAAADYEVFDAARDVDVARGGEEGFVACLWGFSVVFGEGGGAGRWVRTRE